MPCPSPRRVRPRLPPPCLAALRLLPLLSLLLAVLLLPGSVRALPDGMVATIFNGRAPADLRPLCAENAQCSVAGVREVWYGRDQSWRYKLVTGGFVCGNDFFSDPYPYSRKSCFERDLTEPSPLPQRLAVLPIELQLNDLLTTENGRYRVDVVVGMARRPVVATPFVGNLTALGATTDPSLTQDYFQLNLMDTRTPTRQYSLFIAATLERCVNFLRKPDGLMLLSQGRVMELYTLTAQPSTRLIAQRSDTQRICTNDKGQLTFHLKPPSIDAFQLKVVNHGAAGRPNDVFDLYIPTSLNPVLSP